MRISPFISQEPVEVRKYVWTRKEEIPLVHDRFSTAENICYLNVVKLRDGAHGKSSK